MKTSDGDPITIDTNDKEYNGNSKDKMGNPTSYTKSTRYGASIDLTLKKKVSHGRTKRDQKFSFNAIFKTALSGTYSFGKYIR